MHLHTEIQVKNMIFKQFELPYSNVYHICIRIDTQYFKNIIDILGYKWLSLKPTVIFLYLIWTV